MAKRSAVQELESCKTETKVFLDKIKSADSCFNQLLNLGITPTQKYILWLSATNSESIPKGRRDSRNSAMSFLSTADQQRISSVQTKASEICGNIKEILRKLNETKDRLYSESLKLNKTLQEEIYSKMNNEEIEMFNNSIQNVIYKNYYRENINQKQNMLMTY